MFFAIPHLYGAVTAKHPLHYRAFGSLFLGYLSGVATNRLLIVDFGKYNKNHGFLDFFVASRLHSQHSRHLWYFLCLVNFVPLHFQHFLKRKVCKLANSDLLSSRANKQDFPEKRKKGLKSLAPHWRRRIA